MKESPKPNKFLAFISISVTYIFCIILLIIVLGIVQDILDNSEPSTISFLALPRGLFAFISSIIFIYFYFVFLGTIGGSLGGLIFASTFYLIILPLFIWSIYYMIRKKLWNSSSFKRIGKFLGYTFGIVCIFIIIRLLVPSIYNHNSIQIRASEERGCYHFFAIETGYDYICESNRNLYLKYDGDMLYEGKKGTYILGYYGVRFTEFE